MSRVTNFPNFLCWKKRKKKKEIKKELKKNLRVSKMRVARGHKIFSQVDSLGGGDEIVNCTCHAPSNPNLALEFGLISFETIILEPTEVNQDFIFAPHQETIWEGGTPLYDLYSGRIPLDKVWLFTPLPGSWNGYISSSEPVLIGILTRPYQVFGNPKWVHREIITKVWDFFAIS